MSKTIDNSAEYVDARGCTGLTLAKINSRLAKKAMEYITNDLDAVLRAGGRYEEAIKPQHWECHSWENCPMAVAFGARSLNAIPAEWREKAQMFVRLFDCGLIARPEEKPSAGQGF